MRNTDRINSCLSNPPHACLVPWFQRMVTAFEAAYGIGSTFATTFQSPEEIDYHKRYMHVFHIVDLVVEEKSMIADGSMGEFDEETLPFCIGEFSDQGRLLVCFEEVFTRDPQIIELMNAVCSGFAIARDMEYVGPFDLASRGIVEHKLVFAEQVASSKLDFGMKERFNAPTEFFSQPA